MLQTLRNLFFPQTIDGRPLFTRTRVALHIETDAVRVATVREGYKKTTITGLDEYPVNPGDPRTYTQRLGATLKKIAAKIGKNVDIVVTFPSAKVVLKELTLPFLEPEKIRMVVEYEIEAVIPFKLENAIIDFVIISQSEVKESSTILVAAAQKEDVRKLLDMCQKADIAPAQITIDLFSGVSLFNTIPTYSVLKHGYVLLDIDTQFTRITLINNQHITTARTITKGNEIQLKMEESQNATLTPKEHRQKLFDEIVFTIQSFSVKHAAVITIEKVFFIAPADMMQELQTHIETQLHVPCEVLAVEQIISNPLIASTLSLQPTVWQLYSRALGAAIQSQALNSFTLRRKELEVSPLPAIEQQITTAALLLILILGTLGISAYFQMNDGHQALQKLEDREIKRLRNALPADSPDSKKKNIKMLARAVQDYVEEQEALWAAFAPGSLRPLDVLQELSLLLNKKRFDIDIESITILGDAKNGSPIEVKGVFKSKTGSKDFTHFTELASELAESKILMLTEDIDPTPLPDKGISFVAHFKPREDAQ